MGLDDSRERKGIWPILKQSTEECGNLGRDMIPLVPQNRNPVHTKLLRSSRGQVLVLVAIAMIALLGFVALAVDIGFAWSARRRMQTGADAAAVAGAIASRNSQPVTAAADDAASLNGFTDGSNGVNITVTNPYSGGSCSLNCVKVSIEQEQPTFFLGALGFSQFDVKASSVAGTNNSGSCIYGLGPTSPAFDAHGTATVNSTCGILVNTNATCGGNVSLTAPIGVAGSSSSCPSTSTISYTPDPFSYLGCSTSSCMPSCSGNTSDNITNGQTVTLSPGNYCGGITIHNGATVTFSPGIYNLGSGGLNISGGTVSNGTSGVGGVSFVATTGISINGGTVNLSAPTTDTYQGTADLKGILFWDASSSNSTIAGNGGSTFDGALYFPQSQLTYTGTSSSGCGTSSCSNGATSGCGYTIIAADSVKISGTTNLCDDYSGLGGNSPIESTTLFE
jgi:hypothetical protein